MFRRASHAQAPDGGPPDMGTRRQVSRRGEDAQLLQGQGSRSEDTGHARTAASCRIDRRRSRDPGRSNDPVGTDMRLVIIFSVFQ